MGIHLLVSVGIFCFPGQFDFESAEAEKMARTRISSVQRYLAPFCPKNTMGDAVYEFVPGVDSPMANTGLATWSASSDGCMTALEFVSTPEIKYLPVMYDVKSFLSDLVALMGNNAGTYILSPDPVRKKEVTDGDSSEWIKGECYVRNEKTDAGFTAEIVNGNRLKVIFSTPALHTELVGQVELIPPDRTLFMAADFVAKRMQTDRFALAKNEMPELHWGAPDLKRKQATYDHGEISTTASQAEELRNRIAIPYRSYFFNLTPGRTEPTIGTVMIDARDGSVMYAADRVARQSAIGGKPPAPPKPPALPLTPIRAENGKAGKLVIAPRKANFSKETWMKLGQVMVRGKMDPTQQIWRGEVEKGKVTYVRILK